MDKNFYKNLQSKMRAPPKKGKKAEQEENKDICYCNHFLNTFDWPYDREKLKKEGKYCPFLLVAKYFSSMLFI